MKIAIVHDYLNQYGGAEKVVEALHDLYPEAPIYTSIYLPQNLPAVFGKMDIRTSFMQRLPFLKTHFKKYLMLYPMAFERLDLRAYDVILSSSSGFAKGVKIPANCLHICYCYSPMRFAWNYESYMAQESLSSLVRSLLPFFISRLKRWDLDKNKGVDCFIAISKCIQERIRKCYNLPSTLIYPPVHVKGFKIAEETSSYFLVVSRLNAYKRIDLVIEAFNRLGLPLKIVGDGPHRKTLEAMSASNIEFLGKLPNELLPQVYGHCEALIFPGSEDFGIVPVEAQACGRPVIAYASGGALETVIDGVTGLFFKEPNVDALIQAVKKFEKIKGNFFPSIVRNNALRFDETLFKKEMKDFIAKKYEDFRSSMSPRRMYASA